MSGCCPRGLCRPHEKQGFPTNTSPLAPCGGRSKCKYQISTPCEVRPCKLAGGNHPGWRTGGAPTSAPGPTNSVRFYIPRSFWPQKLSEIGILEKPMKKHAILENSEKAPEKTGAERKVGARSPPRFSSYRATTAGREAYPDHFRPRLPGGFTYRPLSRLSARGLGRSLERQCKLSPCKRSAAASGFGNRAFLYFRGFAVSG